MNNKTEYYKKVYSGLAVRFFIAIVLIGSGKVAISLGPTILGVAGLIIVCALLIVNMIEAIYFSYNAIKHPTKI